MDRCLPSRRAGCALALLIAVSGATAEPLGLIDRDGGFVDVFNVGIITGVDLRSAVSIVAQGTPIVGFPEDILSNKSYTAMVGQLGNADEAHETYLERPSTIGIQMASAVANFAGDLEVGVDGFQRNGVSRALSRFGLTIKNYRANPVQLDFAFQIPDGQVLAYDPAMFPATDSRAVEAGVWARIDAVLRTPAGEDGGHYDETEHRLFDFHVGIVGSGNSACAAMPCDGLLLTATANAQPLLHWRPQPQGRSIWGFDIDTYDGLVALPEIAPFGELTIYYDMLARVQGHFEGGGRAMLGDPFDLVERGGSIRFIERTAVAQVPEPASLALAALGVVALATRHRRRR
jgi:hypothetical protein